MIIWSPILNEFILIFISMILGALYLIAMIMIFLGSEFKQTEVSIIAKIKITRELIKRYYKKINIIHEYNMGDKSFNLVI